MSAEESSQSTPTIPGQGDKPFYRKGGIGQACLRLKAGETLEAAVDRLRREGWDIPDISKLEIKTDAQGKYFIQK